MTESHTVGATPGRPMYDASWLGRTRDRIAWAIATFALVRVATPWYSKMLKGSIRLGLLTARTEASPDSGSSSVADRDAELNRWRDPEQPEWVVYPQPDGSVKALNEVTLSQVHRRDPKHSYGYKKTPGNLAIIAWLDAGRPLAPTCEKCGGITGGFDVCKCVIDAVRARRSTVFPDSVITDPSIAPDTTVDTLSIPAHREHIDRSIAEFGRTPVSDDCAIAPVVENLPLPGAGRVDEDLRLLDGDDTEHWYCVKCHPRARGRVRGYCGVTESPGDTFDSERPVSCPECLAFDGCPECGLGAHREPPA